MNLVLTTQSGFVMIVPVAPAVMAAVIWTSVDCGAWWSVRQSTIHTELGFHLEWGSSDAHRQEELIKGYLSSRSTFDDDERDKTYPHLQISNVLIYL